MSPREYSIVLALHVAALLAAFGMSFVAPVLVPYIRKAHPSALAAVHDAQRRIEIRIVLPAIALIFLFGAWMASDRDYWSESWVSVPLLILLVIFVIGHLVTRMLKRMTALAGEQQSAEPSDEYDVLYGRYIAAELMIVVLVLVAVYFMT